MDDRTHAREIGSLTQERTYLRMGLMAIICLAILQQWHIWSVAEKVHIVQETPWGEQSKWIHGQKVSEAKLIEIGSWMAHLQLDVSERTIQFNTETLLNWTDGSYAEGARAKAKAVERRLKQFAASTSFEPTAAYADTEKLRVGVVGTLTTRVNGEANQPEPKAYVAEFSLKSGRLMLKDWYESADSSDPLGLRKQPGQQGPVKAVDVAASNAAAAVASKPR